MPKKVAVIRAQTGAQPMASTPMADFAMHTSVALADSNLFAVRPANVRDRVARVTYWGRDYVLTTSPFP